jgi:glutathione S-transferase
MAAVLYAIPASHPCAAIERALQLKDVPYRRVELIPIVSRAVMRARHSSARVPAVRFDDGARLSGSRALVRELERRAPQPPLLPPRERERERARVERAEEWGDEVLQPIARRVIWAALKRSPDAVMSYSEGARLPLPRSVARLSAPLLAQLAARVNGANDPMVRADLRALPGHLDRIDRWIAEGTLGGDAVNAADLQIGAGLRLLQTIEDVAPAIDDRPAGALSRRVFPDYPGTTPAGALPSSWLP